MSVPATQTEAILQYMKEGNSITAFEALNLFGCMRLAARIGDLRADGYVIESRPVKVNTRIGQTTVARYRLVQASAGAQS